MVRRRSSVLDAVRMQQQIDCVGVATKDKKRSVRLRLNEPQGRQVCGELVVPGTGRLLQSIQGLVQAAHQLWLGKIREAGGLTSEDNLTERVVEEDILHIELLKRPVAGGSNGEHCADGGRFDNRAESLVVVNTRALCKPPEDSASLVTVESPIRERLVGKKPFAGDDVGATRPGNKIPSPIAQKGPVPFLHCRTPIRIGKRGANGGQDRRWWRRGGRGGEDEGLPWHPEPRHGTDDHPVRVYQGRHGHSRDWPVCGHRRRKCGCCRSTWTTDVGDR
jgi:hypothetical protein